MQDPKNLTNSNFSKIRANNCDQLHILIIFLEKWQLHMVLQEFKTMKYATTFLKKELFERRRQKENESKLGILQRI